MNRAVWDRGYAMIEFSVRTRVLAALCAGFAGLAGAAGAQSAGAGPDRIVETYGAWDLLCQRPQPGAERACEITQSVQVQGQARRLAVIAVGRPARDAEMVMVLQLPLGLWLPSGVTVQLDAGAAAVPAQLLRCTAAACVATLELSPAMLAALRSGGEGQGRIGFEMQAGTPVALPIAYNGAAEALAALEARANP